MKKHKLLKIICLIFAIFMLDINFCHTKVYATEHKNLSSEIVMEKTTKNVLYSANENLKLPMASTTKILTCLVVIQNACLDDYVIIDKADTLVEGSSIYLRAGERLKIIDLLYGLMLRSGNDASLALARHVGGSVNNFTKLMNITANQIGAKNSNFVNPHGLSDGNHYTTAYDLGLITCTALDNPVFAKICSTKRYECINSDGYKRVFYNKNKMLSSYDGANGVKTGYTKDAGRCLVSSATRDGMTLVSVVLNVPTMFERSKELLDVYFEKYNFDDIIKRNM